MPIDHRRLVTAGTRLARIAGALYLLIVALGGIAHLAVHADVRVPGFPAGTAEGITTLTPVWLVAYLVTKGVPARRPGRLVPAAASA